MDLSTLQNALTSSALSKKDPTRKVARLRIRVNVRPKSTIFELAHDGVDNYKIPHGISEQVIYKDQLTNIMKLVESDPEGLVRARRSYELRLAEFLKEKMNMVPGPQESWQHKLTPDQYILATKLTREFECTTNTEAIFKEENRRGVYPFLSVEVLEELPPPQTAAEADAMSNVDMLAKALAKANTEVLAQVVELLTAKKSVTK